MPSTLLPDGLAAGDSHTQHNTTMSVKDVGANAAEHQTVALLGAPAVGAVPLSGRATSANEIPVQEGKSLSSSSGNNLLPFVGGVAGNISAEAYVSADEMFMTYEIDYMEYKIEQGLLNRPPLARMSPPSVEPR